MSSQDSVPPWPWRPKGEDLTLLGIQPPAAVLALERITFVADNLPIEFVRSQYRGDRYKFTAMVTPAR